MKNGFIKVAAASPMIRVCDCDYNADQVIACIEKAESLGVKLLAFPELTLTGATCYDMIGHRVLIEGAKKALVKVARATEGKDVLAFVGLPWAMGSRLLSVAAALYDGEILGLVPRTEVEGSRFQTVAVDGWAEEIDGESVPVSAGMLFEHRAVPGLLVAAELGADLDAVTPPSADAALAGATVIVQMASFPETVSSTADAELNIKYQSKRLAAGVVLAAPGKGESSTDNVFSGLCLVAENGVILAQTEQEDSFAVSEIDVEYLMNQRRKRGGFDLDLDYALSFWGREAEETALTRSYYKYPHLPEKGEDMAAYCERMLDIQVSGLVKRMQYAGLTHCVVGISGGVDSTLAVMVCAMAVEKMGLPATNVVACTLPCFGTSSRTKSNAIVVAEQLGAEVRVIDIGKAVYQHFDDIGHAHDDYSIAFENAQARERTQVLMDIANKVNGLDVGTEDLSEFVDGWCTYNGDHTSMYDVNLGLTKTQVRANVSYIAGKTEDKVLKAALYDVLDCPVTPELLPIHDDMIEQKSEDAVGSYSLQDFFTHKMMICGFTPSKTLRLAKAAYGDEFTDEELVRWLTSYCKRWFSQQFKRSCLMDGPAVDAFTVSPRTGFLTPSDGEAALFLKDLEQ
ncbi:MAG: NAD(+) synthase [Oscillospiraceae bacterium]|nr:NAD(+) synthase [Oscillospiraceae bacterium]